MESILEAINEWIKEILIGAINGNLSTMFGDVNEKVGTIAAEVGKTPQGWNANIFSMIQNLSENVIVPIAGLVITYVLCYELISMVTEKNNMHDIETFMFFKWFFKAFVAVFLVTHTFDITMAVFDMAQHIVSGAAGVIGGDTNIDVTEALAAMQEGLKDMEIPELLLLVMETSLVSLCMKIMSVLITVILYGRMIEIYAYCSVSPIPFATMTNREWGQIGNNYLKGLFALGFQGFLIMICVGIYAVLVGEMVLADNLHSAIFSLAAYTVILCFSLFKSGALIVHGFNDENVSTKQFEMMHTAFEQAGQTVKLILHQGPHITPTMANKNYGILIDGKFYDDIVNEWISHYLYGVENSAEEMPEVLAQTNYDQKKWETESAWKTEHTIKLTSKEESKTVIDTDWEKAGVSAENFDDVMALKSTNMAQRYVTDPFEKAVTVQGTVCLNLKAALKDGNIETDFDPENRNDVDTLTMQLGNSKVSGKMDDVEIAVLLCDVCDEEFDSIQTVDPERNIVPVTTVKEGGIMNGGDLPAFDEAEFNTVHKKYRVITRAFADLCNPEAGYAPETAQNSIELKKGEYHDYSVYLNATRYTVEPGHRLAIVVATEDPVNCLIHKTYSVEIDDNSVMVEVPVTKASEDMGLNKAE